MRRLHLLELEDQPWFPAIVRDLATDYLQFIQERFRLDRAMTPLVRRALDGGRTSEIVDLCSGGSGPLLGVVTALAANGRKVHATLTDLYPNLAAFEKIAAASGGLVSYERTPVDARRVPPHLGGLRTMFNAFHHLRPADARDVLHAAAAARQPIAIMEISERSLRSLPVLLSPIFVLLATPFMRPFTWPRFFWTYILPLVPFTVLWDGVVSQLRAYTVAELQALCEGSAPMRWEAGQVPFAKGNGRLTYLIGFAP
ncbi:MAG TPA: hypothetical protein VFK57_09875 [Vicinamibacterales bacterium]|nr:hypothetical protein [Vicinamibacterales bacterium]